MKTDEPGNGIDAPATQTAADEKTTDVGGLLVTSAVRRAGELADDEPQVIAAKAPAPPASAWVRNPITSPQERADAAAKNASK